MRILKRFAAILFMSTLICSAIAVPQQPQAAATGEIAPELAIAEWVQGKEVKLSALKGKKYAVLFFWTTSKQGTDPFAEVARMAKEYQKKDVVFVGIGIDAPDAIREFPTLKDLPFSVAVDNKLATVNLYMRERDRIPMAALIAKDGTLLWRGHPELLDAILKEVFEGKYDLKKTVQRETFSDSVADAMKIRDYPTVLKLLTAELVIYPDNMELVTFKSRLLGTLLSKPNEALVFLDDVLSRNPKNLAFYQLVFAVLKDANRTKEKGVWVDRIIENFGDQPIVLIQLAQTEMKNPVEELQLDNVLKLCRAAYHAPEFRDNLEKGLAADEYARILYYCGRPDKALEISKEAMKLLQGTQGFERAKASVIYYNNVLILSKQIK